MESTGLRARKKQQTRQALRSAALRLMADHGLDKVTVEDIAAAADVSPRTFFNYFSTKEEAIVGTDPEWMGHVSSVLAARPVDEEPLFSVHAVLAEIAVAVLELRELHVLRRKVMAENPSLMAGHVAAFAGFERVLVGAIRDRAGPHGLSEPDAMLLVAAAVAAMRVSLDVWVDSDGLADLPELLDRAIDRLAAGFAPTSTRSAPSPRPTLTKDIR